MARDRANIRVDMLSNTDYRSLGLAAQHLYKMLLIHPTLNYAGVADWRPGRLAKITRGVTASAVREAAAELQAGSYVYVDEDTEEVFIRSFVRHDGLLARYRMPIAMANAYADISSPKIRRFFVHELRRLNVANPSMEYWKESRVSSILQEPYEDMKTIGHSVGYEDEEAIGNGVTHSVGYSISTDETTPGATSTTTPTTTSTEVDKREAPKKLGTRISEDFHVTSEMAQWASANAPNADINIETMKFKNYWEALPGRGATKINWTKTWQNWLLNSRSFGNAASKPTATDKIRDTFAKGQALQAKFDQSTQPELGQ
ncbi:hypothetical protein SAMN04489740_0889 [Arthrobacter alpinus]|uniref:Uncharacterized protein n=1 Tax=Arthrobacter alpinus TaxID=656366 RepID=A0A1H5GZK7_9MICC|nr:hypothetical protein [Arthrobacter alpinus]SEE21065.1 hypothetical protein SAMN04489740_0889 [Arthrobacter alpinus]